MILTKSNSKFIRTRAFSTLSTLSTYASSDEQVLSRINSDMEMPEGCASAQYLQFITKRLENQKKEFSNKYCEEGVEEKYNGLFSLISIAKDPSEKLFMECSERLSKLVNVEDENELNLVYFLNVFSALKNSKDEEVLQNLITLLRKINDYAKDHKEDAKFSLEQIINPNTILWLLKIIVKFRARKHLCLNASQTLLNIVSSHQIAFDYQEDAIIKMFNAALKNLEYEGSSDEENDEELNPSDPNIKINGLFPRESSTKMIEEEKLESSKSEDSKNSLTDESIGSNNEAEKRNLVEPKDSNMIKRKTMSQFSKINTTLFFKIDKSVSDPFENQSQPAINENKESHLGRVLGRREKDKAQLTEDEIMEDKIAD